MRSNPSSAMAAAVLLACQAMGAQADSEVDTIVVTATRAPVSIEKLTADVSVLGRREIEQAGQSSLTDLLRTVPGVEISDQGGPGQPANIFIRGANAGHTVVLIDGVRQTNLNFGTPSLQSLPLSVVDRIEILRGPSSGLYGADAIGGVIQIFTRPAEPGLNVGFETGAGTDGRYRGTIDVGGGSETVTARFVAGQEGGRSDVLQPGSRSHYPDDDRNRKDFWNADIRVSPSANHQFRLNQMQSVSLAEFDTESPPFFTAPQAKSTQTLRNTVLSSTNRFVPRWLSTLRLGQAEDRVAFERTNAFDEVVVTRNQTLTWQNDIALPVGDLTVGAESLEQRISATATQYGQTSRTTDSVFGGYGLAEGAHRFRLNARSDHLSALGRHNTGDIAYGYEVVQSWTLTGRLGRAFKAPTLNDLYYVDPYGFFVPNPNLKPESSRSREISLAYGKGASRFAATIFENRISNLIANFDPDGFNGPLPGTVINAGVARVRGASFDLAYKLADWRLRANATFQDARDSESGESLPRRAHQVGSLTLDRWFAGWLVGAQWQGQGGRYDSLPNSVANRMAGYGLVHLFAEHLISKEWSIKARWNNVFDQRYELAKGYAHERSNLFVSLNYRFNQ